MTAAIAGDAAMQDEAREALGRPYTSSLEHLFDAFARIDAMIRGCVALARDAARGEDPYRGLYISDDDVEVLLAQSTDPPRWAASRSTELRDTLAAMATRHAERLAATGASHPLRLRALRDLFGLSDRDLDLLLLGLAPELSLRFETMFAYLQDDLTKRRPTVDLALNILCFDMTEKLALRERLGDEAPLIRQGLVELFEDPQAAKPSSLGRCLRTDPRIASYLIGDDGMDGVLAPFVTVFAATDGGERSPDYTERLAFVRHALAHIERHGDLRLHLFCGDRSLRLGWARALCRAVGAPLLSVDLAALTSAGEEATRRFDRAVREARLRGAAIFVDDFDDLRGSGLARLSAHALEALASEPAVSIVSSGQSRLGVGRELDERVPVAAELPSTFERTRLWTEALAGTDSKGVLAEIPALASKFVFDGERILLAAAAARARSRWRDAGAGVDAGDLYAACRELAGANLGSLAQLVRPRRSWNDLVLPADALSQLREICDRVRRGGEVFEAWGFERRLVASRGLSVLFTGPSGVGKTMAAEVVAAELALDLYRIDLSAVVNKYIGETEKNLSRVFDEAENASAILFFDEADALFGKRSEVQDARDRYANLETSFLLQRMESYSGISILASNLRRNMDDAFTRRIAFIVQFPPPEAPERLAIWRGAFPATAPLADDVDLVGLAEQFRLTGANIKNIALAAAFLAAGEGRPIAMTHLIAATRRELLKIGRNASKSEFGPWGHIEER